MKKVLSVVFSGFLWLGAIIGVVTVSISVLSIMGIVQPLVVSTGSMSPSFEAGSFILSTQKPASSVETGDIITVPRNDGVLVTHRVVSVEKVDNGLFSIIMKGDANEDRDIDPYVVKEVGKPLAIVPYAGQVVAALNNNRFIIVSLLAGSILIGLIWGTGTNAKKKTPVKNSISKNEGEV